MSFQLVLQSEAFIDIQTAIEWYEAQKSGLGYNSLKKSKMDLKKYIIIHSIIRL